MTDERLSAMQALADAASDNWFFWYPHKVSALTGDSDAAFLNGPKTQRAEIERLKALVERELDGGDS